MEPPSQDILDLENSAIEPENFPAANVVAVPAPVVGPGARASGFGLWVRDLLISAGISVLIITFLYQPVRVEGTSMLPRLEDHDRLFINKFVYHIESIQRGDVVVFHYPRDPEKSYIKRVIGLPGDRIWIDHGLVWLNGVALHENYVPERYRDSRSMAEMVIPDDCYFMMGDHRSISSDSREFGPVERDLVYGKAVFVYWPARDAGVVH
jgi:signal peptidase I